MLSPGTSSAALDAQDAAEALIALGWSVKPPTLKRPSWLVEGETFTPTELLVIAAFAVISPPKNQST